MLKVCKQECNECLFSENRIVSGKRMKEIIKDCVKNDTHFICHKGTIKNQDIVCGGFYKRFSTNLIRIAGRLGAIKYIDEVKL